MTRWIQLWGGRRMKRRSKEEKEEGVGQTSDEGSCLQSNESNLGKSGPDGVGNGSKEPAARRQDVPLCGIPFDHRASNEISVRRTRFNDSAPCLSRNSFTLPKIIYPHWTIYCTNDYRHFSEYDTSVWRWTISLFLCLKSVRSIIQRRIVFSD